jgi:transcriptional regulator with XRE-family HTH domain
MVKDKLQVSLGLAIRHRREALKLSQDDFADTISMHRSYYSAIERGEKNLTLQVLSRVAHGLKARLSDLFRDVGD